ncbi:MAG: FMN-dependent dehydrogenase [Lachnospiraceae bacterium]|uniref:FMN-dependent dehydrogenase n=1 Tax=Candidatus Weimeria bifida TaxID=2599074 RepID=A0A6N7IYL1_9FIRM|nr:FMN-dependent dehydrogenase [Candidatus Weimeria bifida]RRF96227.1 MAG: FMN-dependent dehydrogenase [Lachnospiraceae bacterium]
MENVKSPWPDPEGVIPVTDKSPEDANVTTRRFLDSLHVEMRIIDSVKPDLSTNIFGKTYSTPIMMPAFSHLNKTNSSKGKPMSEYAAAAKELNTLNWVGMETNETFEELSKEGADTVRIIKPFADHDRIFSEIEFARKCGAVAVGMDIDHVAGKDGNYDVVDGLPIGPVFFKDLLEYVKAAGVPFVVKGVLSVNDALMARDAGAAAVFVSHHHGRVPFGIPPLYILPKIKEALAGSGVSIFCDCSIDTGYDAYKALALGADAVAVGRGILMPLLKEGRKGVVRKVKGMNAQLSEMCIYTGVKDMKSFDPSVLHRL